MANEHIHADYYNVRSYHADFTQKLSITSLFCFLQESAWRHASSKGAGWADLAAKKLFWVLAKVEVHIEQLPQWGADVRLETFPKEPELLTAYRDFQLFDAQNQPLVKATSSWHILNMDTKRPVSVLDYRGNFIYVPDYHVIKEKPQKVNLPVEGGIKGDIFKVFPSDIDMNLHVNNTKYVQWAMDTFSFDFQRQHTVRKVIVNFLAEAHPYEACYIETYQLENQEFISVIIREADKKPLASVKTIWN
ncbi:MAG: hypothetical protein LBR36_01695 [Bacteroidales bacterium]|jgi:acyl-ACP thioesterase|nr:hypothetical protein [Bacteroidales bacterium]